MISFKFVIGELRKLTENMNVSIISQNNPTVILNSIVGFKGIRYIIKFKST